MIWSDETQLRRAYFFYVHVAFPTSRTAGIGHGYSCHITVCRPESRGEVKLQSTDPTDTLLIDPNFLGDEKDMQTIMAGAQKMQTILHKNKYWTF